MRTAREVLLSLKNVDITFGKGDSAVRAVKNASFDIYKGETFSLVGESGSGKTTIGRAVIRVNPCAAGEIQYKGVRISGKTTRSLDREVIRNIQMVFQDPAASLNERATVDYIISEGLYNFHLFKSEKERVVKVEKIIEEVGLLPEHLTRSIPMSSPAASASASAWPGPWSWSPSSSSPTSPSPPWTCPSAPRC